MGGWRRAVQLGSRLIRSSSRASSCRTATAVTGMAGAAQSLPATCSAMPTHRRRYKGGCHAGSPSCIRCFTGVASVTAHPQTSWLRTLAPLAPGQILNIRGFADLPAHSELTMPSLSPTMNQVCCCKPNSVRRKSSEIVLP